MIHFNTSITVKPWRQKMKLTKIYATSGHYFTKIASYGTVFPDHLLFTFVELDKIRQFTQNVVKTWYFTF